MSTSTTGTATPTIDFPEYLLPQLRALFTEWDDNFIANPSNLHLQALWHWVMVQPH